MRLTLSHYNGLLSAISQAQSFYGHGVTGNDTMYRQLLDSFVELTASEIGFIARVNWQENGQPNAEIMAASATTSTEAPGTGQRQEAEGSLENFKLDSLVHSVINGGGPLIASNPARSPHDFGMPAGSPEWRTFMVLPIRVADTLVGLVAVANRKKGYDTPLADFLQPLLNLCGILINVTASNRERIRMQSKLEAQRDRLESQVADRTASITEDARKLRGREKYLQNVLGNSPIAIFVTDLDSGLIIFANERALDLFGGRNYAPELARGEGYWVNPCDRERFMEQLSGSGQAKGEARLKTVDGRILQTLVTAQSSPGVLSEAVWWITDLTEIKSIERQLQQKNLMLEKILNHIPTALFVKDINDDFRFTLVNKKHEELFGWPAEFLLGKVSSDFLGPEEALEARREDLEVVRTGRPIEVREKRLCAADGEPLILNAIKIPLPDANGNPSLIVGMCEDLTEKKYIEMSLIASEKRFRDLAEHSPVGIFLTDPRGGCIFVNEAWQTMAGLSAMRAAGDGWLAAIHPDDLAGVEQAWQGLVTSRSPFDLEYRFIRPDHEIGWVKGSAIPLRNEAGQIIGFLGNTTDISHHKRFTAELERSRDEAHRANAAKSEFLSRMSHELRTPLNAVLGFGQLLQMGNENLTPSQNEGIGHILAGGEHLLQLVEDVLDFSRIETGNMKLRLETVSSGLVLKRSITLVNALAAKSAITLQPDGDDFPHLVADQRFLQQILTNLLSNAIKYGKPGGTVTADASILPDSMARISITDNGIGIHPDDKSHVFEPFQRGSNSAGLVDGTGIGLSICKTLVESMGGRIGCESEPGVGSRFWFDLPVAPDA